MQITAEFEGELPTLEIVAENENEERILDMMATPFRRYGYRLYRNDKTKKVSLDLEFKK